MAPSLPRLPGKVQLMFCHPDFFGLRAERIESREEKSEMSSALDLRISWGIRHRSLFDFLFSTLTSLSAARFLQKSVDRPSLH